MDWKSIVLKELKKMKFFNIILISYFHSLYWNRPYGAPNILEPFHLLLHQCSKLHNLFPKNAFPSIFSSSEGIPPAKSLNSCLSFSSQYHLCFASAGIQYAYEHDLYSQHLSLSEYPHCYKSELEDHGIAIEPRLPILCSDTLYTKLCVHLNDLWCDFQSYFPSIKNREICRNYKSCTKSA